MTLKFTALIQRRIRRLTKSQRRFFSALLRERLHLADEFEDSPVDEIVHDCLYYAEVKGLDLRRELADLRAPLPDPRQNESSAALAMRQVQE